MSTPPLRRLLPCLLAAATIVLAAPAPVRARSMADKLHHFIDTNGFPTAGDFPETITPIVERLALRGIDFPVTATTRGFTYQFTFELGVPEHSSESSAPSSPSAPIRSERIAWTSGSPNL